MRLEWSARVQSFGQCYLAQLVAMGTLGLSVLLKFGKCSSECSLTTQ